MALTQPFPRPLLRLLGALAVFRLVLAALLDLGTDESYYWVYTELLRANYFDHPPGVAYWQLPFTLFGWLEDELFLRLGSITGCVLSSLFIYKATETVHSSRAAFLAALLYNASFYSGLTAGLYLMPDAPQMVFWTAALWAASAVLKEEDRLRPWLFFGGAAAMALLCKVHAVFLPAGLCAFALFHRRRWLANKGFWAALGINALGLIPILVWNIRYDFITYRFHSARVTVGQYAAVDPGFFKELTNQLAFNNPVNVVLILAATVGLLFRKSDRHPAFTLFNWIGWPLAAALLGVSLLRDTTLPHWSGPAYITLLPLAASALADRRPEYPLPRPAVWSIGLFLITATAWTAFTHLYPGALGRQDYYRLGTGDLTLDAYGWKEGGKHFADLHRELTESGRMPERAPIVGYKWWAAHQDYHFARPAGLTLIGLGGMQEQHHYLWINRKRMEGTDMRVAYCIVPSDEWYRPEEKYGTWYGRITLLRDLTIERGGKPAQRFFIYRLSDWKGKVPWIK